MDTLNEEHDGPMIGSIILGAQKTSMDDSDSAAALARHDCIQDLDLQARSLGYELVLSSIDVTAMKREVMAKSRIDGVTDLEQHQ